VAVRSASTADLMEAAERYTLNNYGKRTVAIMRGEGHTLHDADGKEYLDFTSGIAVNCLGHSDAGWAEVVARQAKTLTHTSNLFLNVEQVQLAKSLVELSFADKAFFCNSGTEANEAAIKFARKLHSKSEKPRTNFVAFENSFHGRTMGALALTYKEQYRTPFEPVMPSATFLTFNDPSGLNAIDNSTCAVFVEPMQGEGGVIPASVEFLRALRARCDEVGALLVFDEVQCGLGRSGKLFAYEHSGVTPDIMTLAKPLAGGLPIGAVLMTDRVAECINPGDHGSTFAGAPLVCAAANYTVGVVSDDQFLANVHRMGERLRESLLTFVERHGLAVRGQGLLVGVVFPVEDAARCSAVQKTAQDRGLLVLTAGKGNVLRIAPALNVTETEIDSALEILKASIAEAMAPVAA